MALIKRITAYQMPDGGLESSKEAAAAAWLARKANTWPAASVDGCLSLAMAKALINNRDTVRALFDELDAPDAPMQG